MTDSASKRIGEHLLQGWTMLGDSCPNGCNVPLMRSRDKKSLVCLGCEVDFLHQAEKVVEISKAPINVTESAPSCSPQMDSHFTLLSSLDSRLDWISEQIAKSTSVSDLNHMVELASKMVALRKAL